MSAWHGADADAKADAERDPTDPRRRRRAAARVATTPATTARIGERSAPRANRVCEKTFAATAKGKAAASPAIAIAVPGVRGTERTPLEEHDRDRFGEDRKRDGRRKRHGGRKLERPRLRGVDRLLLSRDVARGEFGQEDDADARRNEPERKLDHPVRVVEPGDQRGTEGGRLRRDEDEKLHRGIGGDGEEGGPEKAADVRGPARPREPDRHLVTGEGETDDSKLHESGNARRGGKPGGLAARRHSLLQKFEDEKRADQASIDHERSNCRGSEAPLMIEAPRRRTRRA